MKKVLFLILCCAVFAVGCNKAAEVPAAETEQVEAVSSDVAASTDTVVADVAVSTETMSQGEVK